jgi:hypothetical protein
VSKQRVQIDQETIGAFCVCSLKMELSTRVITAKNGNYIGFLLRCINNAKQLRSLDAGMIVQSLEKVYTKLLHVRHRHATL